MNIEPPDDSDPHHDSEQGRIKYLLVHLWHGNQRAMARAIGVSQGLISQVINGQQAPGPKLLSALATHPGINAEWLKTGTGQPLPYREKGSLPIALGILPGLPMQFPNLLTGSRHPVAEALDRHSRYWLLLTQNSPLVHEPELRLAQGDLLLLEADKAWTRRLDLTDGRICGVRLQARPEPSYHLGRVDLSSHGLVVRLFGGSSVMSARPSVPSSSKPQTSIPPSTEYPTKPRLRRQVKNLNSEEESAPIRRQFWDQAQKAAEGVPIAREDIVGVPVYLVRPAPLIL